MNVNVCVYVYAYTHAYWDTNRYKAWVGTVCLIYRVVVLVQAVLRPG